METDVGALVANVPPSWRYKAFKTSAGESQPLNEKLHMTTMKGYCLGPGPGPLHQAAGLSQTDFTVKCAIIEAFTLLQDD